VCVCVYVDREAMARPYVVVVLCVCVLYAVITPSAVNCRFVVARRLSDAAANAANDADALDPLSMYLIKRTQVRRTHSFTLDSQHAANAVESCRV